MPVVIETIFMINERLCDLKTYCSVSLSRVIKTKTLENFTLPTLPDEIFHLKIDWVYFLLKIKTNHEDIDKHFYSLSVITIFN